MKSRAYVTETLGGRPYQAFVPLRIAPVQSEEWKARFSIVESAVRLSSNEDQFRESCLRTILQPQSRPNLDQASRVQAIEKAFDTACRYSTIDRRRLIELNAILTNDSSVGLRRQPAWIGGTHPAISWHVGSPPKELVRLINTTLTWSQQGENRLFGALVALIRLLQVHPFSDGNGRTARLYFCWLVLKGVGPYADLLRIPDSIWRRSEFDLHSASVEIRDDENWYPFFERCLQAAERM